MAHLPGPSSGGYDPDEEERARRTLWRGIGYGFAALALLSLAILAAIFTFRAFVAGH